MLNYFYDPSEFSVSTGVLRVNQRYSLHRACGEHLPAQDASSRNANMLQYCRVVAILVSFHISVYSEQRIACREHLNNSTSESGNVLDRVGV